MPEIPQPNKFLYLKEKLEMDTVSIHSILDQLAEVIIMHGVHLLFHGVEIRQVFLVLERQQVAKHSMII